jgi:hypothetical protein
MGNTSKTPGDEQIATIDDARLGGVTGGCRCSPTCVRVSQQGYAAYGPYANAYYQGWNANQSFMMMMLMMMTMNGGKKK